MTKRMAAYGGHALYRGEGPCRPWGGRHAPVVPGWATCPSFIFFLAMDLVANLKKKITSRACRPHRATGGIFEIFQNRHIFLKFCFFKYKKEKNASQQLRHGSAGPQPPPPSTPGACSSRSRRPAARQRQSTRGPSRGHPAVRLGCASASAAGQRGLATAAGHPASWPPRLR